MPSRHVLERFCDHPNMGVFGTWLLDGSKLFSTVEQPWNDNIPFKSCIPAGDYDMVLYDSPKYGNTIALINHDLDVGLYKGDAKRWGCLVHPATIAAQLEGCIAPGFDLGYWDKHWAVMRSKVAHQLLMSKFKPGDKLSIIWKDHP